MKADWRARVSGGVVFGLALVALAYLLHAFPGYWPQTCFGFLAALAVPQMVPSRVDLGADGVMIRWLFYRRFVPMARIASVDVYEEEARRGNPIWWVRLVLAKGQELHIGLGARDDSKDRARALAERVRETMETSRDAVEGATAVLDRGDRSIAQWIRDLHAIGAGQSVTLRTATLTVERLWKIVESTRARPVDRAAAAVALSAVAEEDRLRIRVAADATVEPKLRIALQTAAEPVSDENEELAKALEDLETER